MKIDNIAVGLLVLMFALILFVDALLGTYSPASMFLSANDVKGIPGFTFVLVAILIFIKARK